MARTTERNVPLTELNIRGIIIQADGGGQAVTVYPSDSGCIFINKEDAGNVTYTLPAVADGKGKWWWFYNAVEGSVELVITSGTASTFYGSDSSADTSMTTSTNAIGDSCIVIGDGSYYYHIPLSGTWAES
jgi:hypothetical protein